MNRHEKLLKLFGDVLAWLESPTAGPAPWRAELERQLSLAIADFECLGVYQFALNKFEQTLNRLDRIPEVWSHDVPLETVFQGDWSSVDDFKFGALALNLLEIELMYALFKEAQRAGKINQDWEDIVATMTFEEVEEDVGDQVLYGYRQRFRDTLDKAMNEAEEKPELTNDPIHRAFASRRVWELVSLENSSLFQHLVRNAKLFRDVLSQMESTPTNKSTTKFTEHYIRFHSLLASVGPHRQEVEDACDYLYKYESAHPLDTERKFWVVEEHRKIVQAIENGDALAAADALNTHLNQSEARWMPRYHESVARSNASFFEQMKSGSFLCVSTINVCPIETEVHRSAYWSIYGLEVLEAIHRGAYLIYLRPTGVLAAEFLNAPDITAYWEEDLRGEHRDFIDKIAEELHAHYPIDYSSLSEAKEIAESRIQLIVSNHQSLFVRTGKDRTCGYFWSQEGRETFTERNPLKSDVAHPRIEVVDNSLAISSFKSCLQDALQVVEGGENPNYTILNYVLQRLRTNLEHRVKIEGTTHV